MRLGPGLAHRASGARSCRQVERRGPLLAQQGHDDLILWGDAPEAAGVYGQTVSLHQVVRRDLRAHAWDYALAGAMAAVAVVALVTRIDVQDSDAHLFRPDTWLVWVVTIAVCATLIGRRRWPLVALASGLILIVPLEFSRQRDTVAFFALVITLYSVAAYLPPRLAWRGIAQLAAFYLILLATGTVALTAVPALGVLFLIVAFAFGLVIQRNRTREHRESEIAVGRAAAATLTAEGEAADERLRMAQELHDVVAHSLSVIAVQAGIGAHLIDREPAEAARSLDAIRSTCDTTGTELDRLVAILRNGIGSEATAAPSVADISTLVEQIRSADLAVVLVVEGDMEAVPAGLSLSAYRIVQEALTNIVRHAGRAIEATVTILATDDHIELTVDDNGRGIAAQGVPVQGGRNGLVGMRERAQMYGGDAHAGPRPGGGFRVQATLRHRTDSDADSDAYSDGYGPTQHRADIPNPTAATNLRHVHNRLSPWTWDAALGLLTVTIAILEVIATHPSFTGPHFTPTGVWAVSLRVGCAATLTLRRRFPIVGYTVAWVLGVALIIGDYQFGILTLVLLIGLYSVVAYATPWRVVVALVETFVGLVIVAWSEPPDLSIAGAVWASVFFAASAITGHVVRRDRCRRTTELNERQDDAAARTRHARLVVTSERLRIADELGSILSQSIDTIARHAESGSRLIDDGTDTTCVALQTISRISRDSLNDLRRLLKQLRTTTDPTSYSPIASTSETADVTTVGVAR